MPFSTLAEVVRSNFRTWLLPQLNQLPPADWNEAIRKARSVDFDAVEKMWILAGVAAATYLLRFDPIAEASPSQIEIYLRQFFAALPLLGLLVGPAFLRRARRGLDMEIANRKAREHELPD